MRLLATIVLVLTAVSPAFADESDDQYAAYYGDGIRAYAESRYDDALTHLYRAFAIKPNHFALKLIARSHDFQGNCSARANAITMLRDLFPKERVPAPQRCAKVGELRIECIPSDGDVRVDGEFEAPCGVPLIVTVGPHDIENDTIGLVIRVTVERDKTTVASLLRRPDKWYSGSVNRNLDVRKKQVVELPKRWLRPGLLDDPDMPRSFEWKRPAP